MNLRNITKPICNSLQETANGPTFTKKLKRILYFIFSVIMISCNGESRIKSTSTIEEMEIQITQFENDLNFIKNTFPVSLISGDTLKAEIYSESDDWKIIEAYVNCSIEYGVFVPKYRTKLECLELFIDENRAQIEFITVGHGPKVFDVVTLIMENEEGMQRAAEMEFSYYLK